MLQFINQFRNNLSYFVSEFRVLEETGTRKV